MQRTKKVLVLVGVIAIVALAGSLPVVAQKTLAATMNVHVFPADGQTPEQQSTSEAECYNWAVENRGIHQGRRCEGRRRWRGGRSGRREDRQ